MARISQTLSHDQNVNGNGTHHQNGAAATAESRMSLANAGVDEVVAATRLAAEAGRRLQKQLQRPVTTEPKTPQGRGKRETRVVLKQGEPEAIRSIADTIEARPALFATSPSGGTTVPFDLAALNADLARANAIHELIATWAPVLDQCLDDEDVVVRRLRKRIHQPYATAIQAAPVDAEVNTRIDGARSYYGKSASSRAKNQSRNQRATSLDERIQVAQARLDKQQAQIDKLKSRRERGAAEGNGAEGGAPGNGAK